MSYSRSRRAGQRLLRRLKGGLTQRRGHKREGFFYGKFNGTVFTSSMSSSMSSTSLFSYQNNKILSPSSLIYIICGDWTPRSSPVPTSKLNVIIFCDKYALEITMSSGDMHKNKAKKPGNHWCRPTVILNALRVPSQFRAVESCQLTNNSYS